ncbi:MAG: Bifunctional protein FolD protein [Myxococcota bacterium]|nr:Bifunctional protein FolD protein [Myxococcota bacterium]
MARRAGEIPMAILIDGKAAAERLRAEIRAATSDLTPRLGRPPGLAAVLVGDNAASRVYVRNKVRACEECGILSRKIELPASASQQELEQLVDSLNEDNAVDGVLVQLPLPPHLNEQAILRRISPAKDVDGFHPLNAGKLLLGEDCFEPCTPAGVMVLMDRYGIEIKGRHAVVLGRSNIVGKPMAMMLLRRSATVTICHSATNNLPGVVRLGDIVVAAVGRARLVQGDWLKPGAAVIDVGINRLPDGALCGDVDFDSAKEIAGAITPVPGGVGPMTIAMLLSNTLKSARLRGGQ